MILWHYLFLFRNLWLIFTLDSDNRWIVLVTVTESYDIFFQNWLVYFEKLELNLRLIVFAEDTYIYEKYKNRSNLTVRKSQYEEVRIQSAWIRKVLFADVKVLLI